MLRAEHLICEISNVIERVYADNIHMIDAETKILGISHVDFGLYVSIRSKFSSSSLLSSAATTHH